MNSDRHGWDALEPRRKHAGLQVHAPDVCVPVVEGMDRFRVVMEVAQWGVKGPDGCGRIATDDLSRRLHYDLHCIIDIAGKSLHAWFDAPRSKVFENRLKAGLEVFGVTRRCSLTPSR